MPISIVNAFKYYNGAAHQVRAVEMLQDLLAREHPEVLRSEAEWVKEFRNQNTPPIDKDWDPFPHRGASTLSYGDYVTVAKQIGIEVAALQAIEEVETSGGGFNKDGTLKALYEGQIADWLLRNRFGIDTRTLRAQYPTIIYPVWTKAHYIGGVGEYSRIETAMKIHREVALMSCSWGLPQVLGLHYEKLGYKSVDQMLNMMELGEVNQLDAMARYLEVFGLVPYIKAKNWDMVARLYNGPGYAKNAYHTKLANAYAKYSA